MTEGESKVTCWSCGRDPAGCICGEDFTPIELIPPKVILPFCGGGSATATKEPWEIPNRFDEVMPRPCCRCDKSWPCTHSDWIYGACPHCGASGSNGSGKSMVSFDTSFNKNSEKLLTLSSISSNSDTNDLMQSPKINENPINFPEEIKLKNLHFYLDTNPSGEV